jgi:hypothetical protein
MKVDVGTKKGTCGNCNQYRNELFPVFIEGHTEVGKCEYWCKECLKNKK